MAISANFSTTQPSLLLDFANTATLDPRVTFTRSVPATYYDNHTSTLAEQNSFVQSNNFATTWSLVNIATPTQGATDPFGGATAWTLDEGTATGTHNIYQAVGMQSQFSYTYTLSVYAQNVTGQYVQLSFYSALAGAAASAIFDLSTGTVANSSGSYPVTGTACVLVPSTTWYRCSLSVTIPVSAYIGAFSLRIAMTNATTLPSTLGYLNSYTGTSRTINIYGAQFEQRASTTIYTPTTTSPVVNFIPTLQTAAINVPRFDYDPVTRQAVGLMVEQQSTNLTTQSQTFSSWITGGSSTVTNNVNIAPNGTLTTSSLIPTAAAGNHYLYLNSALGSGTFTFSVYAKAAGYPRLGIRVYDGSAYQIRVTFDLSNGTIALLESGTATITSVGNGWYRCTGTGYSAAGSMGSIAGWTIESLPAGLTVQASFTGDGYSGAYIWGAQIEALPFASSYIATTTAATVRTADLAVMTGTNFSSWFNSGQGTFYTDSNSDILNAYIARSTYNQNAKSTFALLSGGDTLLTANIYVRANSTYNVAQFIYAGSGTDITPSIADTINISINIDKITAYINNQSQLYGISAVGQIAALTTNGGRSGGNSYANANSMTIGYNSGYFAAFSGHIKKLAFYPAQLTNAQIQNLTL
jgi:hypothetical protein